MNIFERTRKERERVTDGTAPPSAPPSTPSSEPAFGKAWTPQEREAHQKALARKLREWQR